MFLVKSLNDQLIHKLNSFDAKKLSKSEKNKVDVEWQTISIEC